MTELATLARPYAEAAFKRAKETNSTAEWSEAMVVLTTVMQDVELMALVDNPRVSAEQVMRLLLDICQDYIGAEPINFLKILIENKRLKLVSQIAQIYEQFKSEDEGYINVDIYTAYELTPDEQNRYVAMLQRQLNKEIRATVWIDKSLIGGILAKAGDKVIDGSISGRLNQLAKRL